MRWIAALLAVSALTLGACGTSKEDKALSQVCDARADIGKQADALTSMSMADITRGKAGDALRAVRDDLKTIADAQGDLSGSRKSEVEAANQKFKQQIQTIGAQLAAGGAMDDAATQAKSSLTQLATTYKDTYGRVDCSGS